MTLTLAPIDYRLITVEKLTAKEKKWLKDYHNEIFIKFNSKLSADELLWMTDIVDFYNNL